VPEKSLILSIIKNGPDIKLMIITPRIRAIIIDNKFLGIFKWHKSSSLIPRAFGIV
jgi:hypothetical protein